MTTHETTGPEATDEQRFIAALWDDLKAVLDDATEDDTPPDQVRRAARQLARALIERLPAATPVAVTEALVEEGARAMYEHDLMWVATPTAFKSWDETAAKDIYLGRARACLTAALEAQEAPPVAVQIIEHIDEGDGTDRDAVANAKEQA